MSRDFGSSSVRRQRTSEGGGDYDGLMIVACLVFLGILVGVGFHMQQSLDDHNSNFWQSGLTPGLVWTFIGVQAGGFFLIIVPLVLLGFFITGLIFRFTLDGGAYLRAAGVAAIFPSVVMVIALITPSTPLVFMLMAAGAALTFVAAKLGFGLKFVQTIVAAVFCIPLLMVGMTASKWASQKAIVDEAKKNQTARIDEIHALKRDQAIAALTATPPPGMPPGAGTPPYQPTPSTPPPNPNPDLERVAALESEVTGLRSAMRNGTSEQMRPQIDAIRSQLESIRASVGATPQWRTMSARLDRLNDDVSRLPSEKPDESIYQPLVAQQTWKTGASDLELLGEEISFGPTYTFNVRPPKEAALNLADSTGSQLSFKWPRGWNTLTIKFVSASDLRQQRPWILPSAVASLPSRDRNLFVLEQEASQPQPLTGTIDGQPFTRIEQGRSIVYAARIDNKWLLMTLESRDSAAQVAMEAAVRSFRKRGVNEPPISAFGPRLVVAGLAEEPERALNLLRNAGPAAEQPLVEYLQSSAGQNLRRDRRAAALALLADIATDKSTVFMKELLASNNQAEIDLAQRVLQRIAPTEFDGAAMAMDDLKSGDRNRQSKALKNLAAMKADPQKPQVTRAIELVLLENNFFTRDEAAAALAIWANAETVPKFLPWLDEKAGFQERRMAMKVLAGTKDRRAVYPIVRWIIKDADNASAALISMGPVAEDEVIKLLGERDAEVRKNAARILQEIGTAKCLTQLQRASNDPRDATAAATAKVALDTVRERVRATRPPTTRP